MGSPALAIPPRLASPEPEGPRRPDEDARPRWWALLLSLLLHAGLVVAALLLLSPAPVDELLVPDHVRVLFVEPPRDVVPTDTPPDTDVSSTVNSGGPEIVPNPPARREPSRPRETPPQPAVRPEPAPEEAPSPDTPGIGEEKSREEKLQRLNDLLRGVRGSSDQGWANAPTDLGLEGDDFGGGSDVQFESKADVDWGPYALRIKQVVRSNWRIPVAANLGMRGIVTVHFYIRRDGGIEDLEIVSESGNVALDVAGRDAIALSDALPPPPIPADLDEERVGVTWSFLYNVPDSEYRAWKRQRRLQERRGG